MKAVATVLMTQVFDRDAVAAAIEHLSQRIAERHAGTEELGIVGIANGGIPLAQRLSTKLSEKLGRNIPWGSLNAQFHRDDVGHKPIPKAFMRTDIPFVIDGITVILTDDVLFSGRTTRAAMNELFDHGRPTRVELAALCDRGGRRLPIQADYVGLRLDVPGDCKVTVVIGGEAADEDSIRIEEGASAREAE